MRNVLPAVVVSLLLSGAAAAQQHSFQYTGYLESDSVPMNGPVALTFVLEDEGGAELGRTDGLAALVSAGVFSVEVGPFPDAVLAVEPLFVRVGVDGVLLGDRQAFVTAPGAVGAQRSPGDFLVQEDLTVSGQTDVQDLQVQEDLTVSGQTSVQGLSVQGLSVGSETVSGTTSYGSNTRQMINLYATDYALGVQNSTLYQRTGGGFGWYQGGTHGSGIFDAGGGVVLMSLNGTSLDVRSRIVARNGINLTGTLSGGALGANCSYTEWVIKSEVEVNLTCPAGRYQAGMGFRHPFGLNGTHQESVRLYCCSL